MAVERRVIWLSDEQWAKMGERAEALGISRSAYIAKLIEWRQPEAQSPRDPFQTPKAYIADSPFTAFRPVPKPGRK